MSLDPSDLNGPIDDLNEIQLSTLDDWFKKFSEKYPRVGILNNDLSSSSVNQGMLWCVVA